jgi:hypothetical protein
MTVELSLWREFIYLYHPHTTNSWQWKHGTEGIEVEA